MHPDDFLVQLKAKSNPRKQRNLEIIHAVCKEQSERGSKDFTIATVAKYAKIAGGPAASTIHNRTGDDFKALIAVWSAHVGGEEKKPRPVAEDPFTTVLDQIDNPAVRALMGAVLAENKKLKREINLLKANTDVTIDLRGGSGPVKSSHSANDRSLPIGFEALPATVTFTSSERDALLHAISERLLVDEGWKNDAYGRILTNAGRQIFKPGFLTAVSKVVAGPETSPLEIRDGASALAPLKTSR